RESSLINPCSYIINNGGEASDEPEVAVGHHHLLEVLVRHEEVEAPLLQLRAVVHFSVTHGSSDRLHRHALPQLLGAEELQSAKIVPVGRRKHTLKQLGRLRTLRRAWKLLVRGQPVRVHEPKQNSERRRLDVVQGDAWHRGLRHGPEELRPEHRRAGGEHGPVRAERLAGDREGDVRAVCAVEQAPEMVAYVGRRDGDGVVAAHKHGPAHQRGRAVRREKWVHVAPHEMEPAMDVH
uniref:Uncharacterized protein n=1 Tax=Triticum urartu TaxID=4572 RepID=A0A8R7QWP1_TRIUA